MYSKKQCTHLKDIFLHAFHFNNTKYCEKGIACAIGFIFDMEANMCYLNGMLYHFKRSARVEGNTHFKEMHGSFQGNHWKRLCWLKGLTGQCQHQTQSYKLIGCLSLCFGTVFWHILRHKSMTRLPNPCPKPLNFPQGYLHLFMFLRGFESKPQTQKSLLTLRGKQWQRVRSCYVFLFCQPTNQETKKRNQKQQKKNKIAHPNGGVVAQSWVLSFLSFHSFCFV